METTVREFIRNFRKYRQAVTRGKILRVKTPEGIFLLFREKPVKTCGTVLEELVAYAGRGFLTETGATTLESSQQKPTGSSSPVNVKRLRNISH